MPTRIRPARTIIRDPSFEQEASGLFGVTVRADDIVDNCISWTLARVQSFDDYPVVGSVDSVEIRAFVTLQIAETPALIVLFSVSDDVVTLHHIRG